MMLLLSRSQNISAVVSTFSCHFNRSFHFLIVCIKRYRAPARSLVAMESQQKTCGNSNTFQWEFATQDYGADVTCRRSIATYL